MLKQLIPLAIAPFFAVACQRLSPAEAKLVGKWETHSVDATESITFRPNHTFATEGELGGDYFPVASGAWRLDGGVIVRHFTRAESKESAFMIGRELRDRIAELTEDKLVVQNGITYERHK